MMIIKKRLIIDVAIIVSTIIAKEYDFSIKWNREKMHVVRIDIKILCNDEHELIWNFIKRSDLRVKKK